MKVTDMNCQNCSNFDTCRELDLDSNQCGESYEYYKCKDCVDRVQETGDIPRCFRGGIPCNHIKMCSVKP